MKTEFNKKTEKLKKITNWSTGKENFSVKLKVQWKLSPKDCPQKDRILGLKHMVEKLNLREL